MRLCHWWKFASLSILIADLGRTLRRWSPSEGGCHVQRALISPPAENGVKFRSHSPDLNPLSLHSLPSPAPVIPTMARFFLFASAILFVLAGALAEDPVFQVRGIAPPVST